MRYDSIIIGAGHNGLVAAVRLAKAGQRVLVLEKRHSVGGIAITEELIPRFHFNTCVDYIRWLHPRLLKELKLEDDRFKVQWTDPSVVTPLPDGNCLRLSADASTTAESIRQFSKADAENWSGFIDRIAQLVAFLEPLYSMTPPPVPDLGLEHLISMRGLLKPLRKYGRKTLVELLRVLPMTMPELLDEWFESEPLRGTLAASAIHGLCQGPMAVGTAYLFLHNHVGCRNGALRPAGFVQGGMGNFSNALAAAAEHLGVDIRTNAIVRKILTDENQAGGVLLGSGEEFKAHRIISNAGPSVTLLDLVGRENLEPRFTRKVKAIKYRGAMARIHLALNDLPRFRVFTDEADLRGVISISPKLEYLERAYDAAKYGRCSYHPYLEIVIPSLTDSTLAPDGKHTMSITLQYAPYQLRQGEWNKGTKEALLQSALSTVSEYAPGFGDLIEDTVVLSPLDLEEQFGLTEGNINHGEMMLDQFFFMRPVAGWAQYRTPIENLYLCGSGTHPGGGITGAPGWNASREILRDLKN